MDSEKTGKAARGRLKAPKFSIKLPKLSLKELKLRVKNFSFFKFSARLSLQEQALFAKRLSLLSKAGVPILESLGILKRQTQGSKRKMFDAIAHDTANGQFLHKSLGKFRRVFGDFAINIIKVGETSGTLSDNLKYLAEEIDKKRELRGKVIGALIYPIVILIAAFAVTGLLTLYLFPKLLPVFQSLRVDLPFTTRALITFSNFLADYGLWVIAGIIAAIISIIVALRFKPVRFFFHSTSLRLPIIGPLIRYYHLTNMCRTLGLLLKGQVRVLEAITVAADTSTNLLYNREIQNLHRAITKGSSIARHLEHHPRLFPILLTDMIAIGEKTGNLSDTLLYIAQIYEQELDEQTKRLSSVIEPAMMILMGILVGFVAISIITPIYEVTRHLNPR